MINPVDRLSWQEMLGHPASAGHLVDTQVNTAYNKMAVLSDHIDEFKDLYDFVFRIKGWLKYYLQANYGLEDFSDIGLNNDTNGHSGSIDLINPATGEVKTKKVWRIYIKNYDEIIKASEAGTTIPDPIVRFANIYDPLNPVYLDLEYKNGKPTFSGTFNPDDTNSYIPLWYLNEQIAQLKRDFKITLVGDATGSGTMDDNVNVVVSTTVSHATNADHAASADKTTGGTVNITGYVSGSGSFDSNGNVTVDVVPNIPDTPYTYYVGKTNARDYWGKDENGNQWGSTQDHPFASLAYAVNQTNAHIFPGNGINIEFVESGEYQDTNAQYNVSTPTYVHGISSSHPVVRGAFEMNLHGAGILFVSVDFAISHISADEAKTCNGVTFIRTFDSGTLWFRRGCRMVIDADNYGRNEWGFITMYGQTALRVDVDNGQTGLILELAGNGTTCHNVLQILDQSYFSATSVDADRVPAIRINAPSGTKLIGPVINTSRFTNAAEYTGANYPHYPWFFDWAIHDCSELSQVNLGKFAYLGLKKNPNAGVALPGDSVGSVGQYAEYAQQDY